MALASTQTITHDYITQNGKVVRETIKTDGTVTTVMDFIYDASGKPFALNYSVDGATPTTYYYILNLQGDVVQLRTADGTVAATYTYDAWGKVISYSGTMAGSNPLRYRGYYCDTETGFYYLQSRYYDPELHRFINADSLASTGQGFLGTNMFAYCNNNPVNYADETGHAAGGIATPTFVVCDGGSSSEGSDEERTEESTGQQLKSAGQALIDSIDASIGIGGGFYVEGSLYDCIGVNIGTYADFARLHLNDGELFWDSSAGTYFVFDILGVEFGGAESSHKRWEDTEWTDENWAGLNPYQDSISLFGGGAYFMFFGGSFDFSFDFAYFFEKLEEIFG